MSSLSSRPNRNGILAKAAFTCSLMLALVLHPTTTSAATATSKPSAKAPAAEKLANPLPVMNVTDVKTGKDVALAGTFDGTKPVLVWFWAPH